MRLQKGAQEIEIALHELAMDALQECIRQQREQLSREIDQLDTIRSGQ